MVRKDKMKAITTYKNRQSEFLKAIDSHDAIYFDLFDVLLGVKILDECDVVTLSEFKAKKKGIDIARFWEFRKSYVLQENNIREIYNNIKEVLPLSNEIGEQLYQIELKCWEQLIFERTDIIKCLEYAVCNRKEVFIVNNSFFEKSFVIKLFKKFDILNQENKLISQDNKQLLQNSDVSKRLYVISKEKTQYFNGDVFKIKSPQDLLMESSYSVVAGMANNINERLMVARLAAKIFASPFAAYGDDKRPTVNTIEDFTYLFIAPFVSGFMVWLLKQVTENHFDKLLLSARDGYIIQMLYKDAVCYFKLKNVPEDIYFQISRTLCVAATVFSEEDIANYSAVRYALGPEEMLHRRFGLASEDIIPYDKTQFKDIINYALAHKDKILVRSTEIRNNYCRYMDSLGISDNGKYAFFDFVSSGTCQLLLDKIKKLDLEGIYACRYFPFQGITNYTSAEEKHSLPISAYVINQSTTEKESCFFADYNFLETVFTSPYPSVSSMNADGPVFDLEQRTDEDLLNVKKSHVAIRQYFNEFIDSYVEGESISFSLIDKIFSLKDSEYTDEQCSYLNECELIEDFGQGRIKLRRK